MDWRVVEQGFKGGKNKGFRGQKQGIKGGVWVYGRGY